MRPRHPACRPRGHQNSLRHGDPIVFSASGYTLIRLSTTLSFQPNLVPPLTSTDSALAYQRDLQRIAPATEWLMTLYLHPDVTPDEVRKAARAGIRGVWADYHWTVSTTAEVQGVQASSPILEG